MEDGTGVSPALGALVDDLRRIIAEGRGRAAAVVSAEVVATYWQIGEHIVREEQGGAGGAAYGEQVLEQIGRVLGAEHGRGFAARSLRNMRQFYLTYPKWSSVWTELGWSHYRTLMRLPEEQRTFYARVAVGSRWSSRELDRQINAMLYERTALSRTPKELLAGLPSGETALAAGNAGVFRDPYLLDFLGLEESFSEKDLEAALVRNIEKFLLELGSDFCFVGRQKRITIGDEDYYIDLVFYRRGLRCLVLIDLKIGSFSPADAAQMKLYLNWVRKYDLAEGENDPIGLILCGSRNEQVVELLLADSARPSAERIKVAHYLLLNSEEAIKQRLAEISAAYDEARAEREAMGSKDDGPLP